MDGDIVVTGKRVPDLNPNFYADLDLGFVLGLIPQDVVNADIQNAIGDLLGTLIDIPDFTDRVFHFPNLNLKVTIDYNSFSALSTEQQAALNYLMANFPKSSKFAEMLAWYENKGVTQVQIHIGPKAIDYNGNEHDHVSTGQVYYDYDPSVPDRTAIFAKGPGHENADIVSVNINPASLENANLNDARLFVSKVIHEMMHPFIPDTIQYDQFGTMLRDGNGNPLYDDHPAIVNTDGAGTVATNKIFDGTEWSNPFAPESNIETSSTYLGGSASETIGGTSGSDVIAGMGGNDSIYGYGGDNSIYGGIGNDYLVSSGGRSDLLDGGHDADTYVVAASSQFVSINELSGGFDNVTFDLYSSNYDFSRVGDSLVMRSSGQTIIVQNAFLDGYRVENFNFTGEGGYAWSYIAYLADGSSTGVCYDEYGWQVVCSNFAAPVGLDLNADGISLISLTQSNVRFDVDGDGTTDKIAWVGNDDGVLVLDRDSNGQITDFTELTFLYDFRGAGSDLEGLLAFDDNRDGYLTATDAVFSQFKVWRDADGDGTVGDGELVSLAQIGLQSLSLEIFNRHAMNPDGADVQVVGEAHAAVVENGAVRNVTVYDLFMRYDADDCGCGNSAAVSSVVTPTDLGLGV